VQGTALTVLCIS